MPGIYGVANGKNAKSDLENMVRAMRLYDHFIQDELFLSQHIGASRVHTGQIGEPTSPANTGGYSLWIEGEAYNVADVAQEFGFESGTLSELLLTAQKEGLLDKCLNRLDGYFCAALYDADNQKLKLISDRYGMRLLYWYHKNGMFTWGSEVKAVLAVNGVNKELDATSYACFMDLGHPMGEHTWFEHIKLIKPATVIDYDLSTDEVQQHHYWKWSEIKRSNLTFDEAVDELGLRFIKAVRRRFNPRERIGISLSGGLDSRAIFAAIDHLYPDYRGYAYTFGIPGCDDITIAEQVVARAKNWRHKKYYISSANWFEPRIEKIWNTDGMLDMMHMHGSEFVSELSDKIDVNLNGFLGDAVLGGSYLKDHNYLNQRINRRVAEQLYGRHAEGYCEDFYTTDHYDNYLYMIRGRRFINYGIANVLPWLSQRTPFFDIELIDFVFSIPDDYRSNNRLYSAMLQKYFPKYFRDIPWQKTGKPAAPITKSGLHLRVFQEGLRITRRIIGTKSTAGYTDYSEWIRDSDVSKSLSRILDSKSARYQRLTNDDLMSRWLAPHLEKRSINNSSQVLRATTIELYLLRVIG